MRLIRQIWRVAAGILKEISDEGAYQRHLSSIGRPDSPDEWRRFWDARMRRKYQRAKCC